MLTDNVYTVNDPALWRRDQVKNEKKYNVNSNTICQQDLNFGQQP